ncbi:hypothetical protein [Streptomyces sp. CA-106110]|uniref:hypothetical protein n=1 Tax=Streptomyces sp. CA-106110 TaxID=3240044 RepID=UPI003D8AF995
MNASMLLLADVGFGVIEFLREVASIGAQCLVLSSVRRCPILQRRLPDGSWLPRLHAGTNEVVIRAGGIRLSGTHADGCQTGLTTRA